MVRIIGACYRFSGPCSSQRSLSPLIVTGVYFALGRSHCGSDALEVGWNSFSLGTLLPKQDCALQLFSQEILPRAWVDLFSYRSFYPLDGVGFSKFSLHFFV